MHSPPLEKLPEDVQTGRHVAVLLATYNGEHFLGQQLASLLAQTHSNWSLWVSDDGSRDSTWSILEAFARAHGTKRIHLVQGPRKGFVQNFLSLACDPDVNADYFAFCDQDDVWFETKLENAIAALDGLSANEPAVYTARTQVIAEDGTVIGLSPLFLRPPGLKNALVQSIGGGNTTVFNRATRKLLRLAGADIDVPSHDWWTYLVASSCGGRVIYDPQPCLRYRQHANNIIGENASVMARLVRAGFLLRGRFGLWVEANLKALARLKPHMPQANADIVARFEALRREPSRFARVVGAKRLALYRQTFFGTISLYAAAFLGKW